MKIIGLPIHSFDEEAFYGLTNLQCLHMIRCQIAEMPPLHPVKNILKTLSVAHNQIRLIPEEYFHGFTKLRILNLANNLLKSVSELHSVSATLRILDLDSNRLQHFPTSVHNATYVGLCELMLRNNKLRECRNVVLNNFPHLTLLDLMVNLISHVNDLRLLHRSVQLKVRDFTM